VTEPVDGYPLCDIVRLVNDPVPPETAGKKSSQIFLLHISCLGWTAMPPRDDLNFLFPVLAAEQLQCYQ